MTTETTADAVLDERPGYGRRMGWALCTLIEKIPADHLPDTAGVGAIITVNLDHQVLVDQIAAATLSTGTRISAGRPAAWPASCDSCRQSSAASRYRSTTAGPDGCSPDINEERRNTATVGASSPAATDHPTGASRTTRDDDGPTAAPPISTTAS
jgi:hypothetical protein